MTTPITSSTPSSNSMDASAITGTNTSEGFNMNAELASHGISSAQQQPSTTSSTEIMTAEEKIAMMKEQDRLAAEEAEYQELADKHNGKKWSAGQVLATILTGGLFGLIKAAKDDANDEKRYQEATAKREELLNGNADQSQLSTTAVATTDAIAKVPAADANSITGTNPQSSATPEAPETPVAQ